MTEIDRKGLAPGYWRRKPLETLNRAEWEALCDGCGRCCLLKLEDEDDGSVHYTSVHCRLYDPDTCRCGNYAHRKRLVPGCVQLNAADLDEHAPWMPSTCAYRLLHEGGDLPEWHPLVCGDPEGPRKAGVAMQSGLTPEWEVPEDELEDHVMTGIL